MKGFGKTVLIVTIFSVCEKFLGFLYRIFLSHTIGSEGIGLYQVAISVFALILTLSCSGTPITVSRLMTKHKAEGNKLKAEKVVSAGIIVTFLTTLPICVFFFIFNNMLNFAFADARCKTLFFILLPALVFTSIYAVLRGVFWGNKDFLPYSIIELIEEIAMIICGVVLISGACEVFKGSIYASVAVLFSFLVSFILATIVFFVRKNKIINPKGEVLPLLKCALPITAMRSANSFISSLVSIILPARLMLAGFSSAETMSMFGSAMGQAIPILFIPSALIGSFTLVLIPELSENYYKKEHTILKDKIEKAIKFATFFTCLFLPLFFVCGEEIGIIVFGSEKCGKYLTASSFLMFFIGISNMTTSILNSIGKENKTLIYFIISAGFMLLSIWFLPKYIGIYALLVGFTFVFGLTSVLNLILIKKSCVEKPQIYRFCFKAILLQVPALCLGLMLEKLVLFSVGNILSLIICTAVLIPFNALLFIGFNLVSFEDIKEYLPKRKKNA